MKTPVILLPAIFIIATCGIIYELVAGTVASYILGDSVTQFSLVIGIYLFAMGIGSHLSKYIKNNILEKFIEIEILIGIIGGFSATILYITNLQYELFPYLLYFLVFILGTFVGIEIPLVMRLLKNQFQFDELVARVFSLDYIGALIASLIFPLLLIPKMGILRTPMLFGFFNIIVVFVLLKYFKNEISKRLLYTTISTIALVLLVLGFYFAPFILKKSEENIFGEKIIFAKSSQYQRIVITKANSRIRLHLNGNLQFSSDDEYRYHESLVHPAMHANKVINHILVLGGGDGLAVREILKYNNVNSIKLVDLDKQMSTIFSSHNLLLKLNHHSLTNKKVHIINEDAFMWLKKNKEIFDIIIVDFPDPSNFNLNKLYSDFFYKNLISHITDSGIICIQSTSPFYAQKSFWCINKTIKSTGLNTLPYHCNIPSFGEWGFILASKRNKIFIADSNLIATKYYTKNCLKEMCSFPNDMAEIPCEINRLNDPILVNYFETEWNRIRN